MFKKVVLIIWLCAVGVIAYPMNHQLVDQEDYDAGMDHKCPILELSFVQSSLNDTSFDFERRRLEIVTYLQDFEDNFSGKSLQTNRFHNEDIRQLSLLLHYENELPSFTINDFLLKNNRRKLAISYSCSKGGFLWLNRKDLASLDGLEQRNFIGELCNVAAIIANDNYIAKLKDDVFKQAKHVKMITLDNNFFQQIPNIARVVNPLAGLEVLSLKGNPLTEEAKVFIESEVRGVFPACRVIFE